jgi:hypothetical protein
MKEVPEAFPQDTMEILIKEGAEVRREEATVTTVLGNRSAETRCGVASVKASVKAIRVTVVSAANPHPP